MGDFFTGSGNKISARDFVELYRTCRLINSRVSQKNYNNLQRERYYILNLLPVYAVYSLVSYPVIVEKVDIGGQDNMPDFRISDCKSDYILEATMGTTEEYITKSVKLSRQGKTYKNYKVWTENGKARVELYEEAGSGFRMGFEQDKAFAIIVSERIINKTKSLPSYKIPKDSKKELLVYYNFPGGINVDYAENWLFEELKKKEYYQIEPKFDKVHIQKDLFVLYDIFGENRELTKYKLYEYLHYLSIENPAVFEGLPNNTDN